MTHTKVTKQHTGHPIKYVAILHYRVLVMYVRKAPKPVAANVACSVTL